MLARMNSRIQRWLESKPQRYALALAVTAFFLVLRGVLDPVIGSYVPYLAVLPAIVFSAWFCGLGPSILSMLLAFLGEQYWFIPPFHTLRISGTPDRAGAIVYFLVSLTIIIFAETTRRITAKLATTTDKLRETGEELGRSHAELEQRVSERTSQLQQTNVELRTQTDVVRQLSSRLLQMQDEERRRIARELHDSVGQIVAALGMNLSAVQRESDHLSPDAAADVAESANLVSELSRQIRTISHLLHPPLLDEVGLVSALQHYVEGFAERSKIQVSLDLPTDLGRLPPEMETAIFRIVQECLTNVHRHSGSTSAAVRIAKTANQLRLEVQDAGKGIPSEKQSEIACHGKTGVGMSGMRERLRQFGGQLEVTSVPGQTVVAATLPVRQAQGKSAISA
ncbi:MAG: domain S-box [Candidatus Acidoferrum typicum]|nr:domain S-box [Candidatus Acidoferrum typicum]